MDFLQSMQIFVSVVDHGSFTKAAAAMRMARPSVSTAVQGLETDLGARLLHRTTRNTTLTAEGEHFYERATQILAEVAEAKTLYRSKGTPRGRLRVDLPVALARPVIIPRLPEFAAQYPHIEIILGVSDQPVDLIADGIDCVVRLGGLQNSSLVARRIAHARMVNCAAPAYLERHGTPACIHDLRSHQAVHFFSGRDRRVIDWHYLVDNEERTIKMKPAISVNDTEAFLHAGLAGFGLMQALGITVEGHLASGELVEILPDVRPNPRPISVLYPSKAHLAPQVRAFIEWVSEAFTRSTGLWLDPA
jgi:LysR family transcriptional regulator, regulator for bpeEF and oprC